MFVGDNYYYKYKHYILPGQIELHVSSSYSTLREFLISQEMWHFCQLKVSIVSEIISMRLLTWNYQLYVWSFCSLFCQVLVQGHWYASGNPDIPLGVGLTVWYVSLQSIYLFKISHTDTFVSILDTDTFEAFRMSNIIIWALRTVGISWVAAE